MTGAALPQRAVIAVDGIDGSGKTRFAAALADACAEAGTRAALIHVDDFRRPVDWSRPDADEATLYYDRYYDLPALDACLRAFSEGAPAVRVPRYDPARDVLDGEQELRFGDAPLAIVEGVFVLRVEAAAAAPLIALEVSEEEARRRLLARDLARGRPREVVEHRLAHRYQPAQRRYRAAFDPADRADVLIDNERWDQPRMLRCEISRLPATAEAALSKALAAVVPP